MAVYLYVSPPVSALQLDLDTQGIVSLAAGIQKDIFVNRLPSGLLRIVIFGLNQDEFEGFFAIASSAVAGITNVVGAKADGSDAHAAVTKLSQIGGVALEVIA
jgi:hypothetical protein